MSHPMPPDPRLALFQAIVSEFDARKAGDHPLACAARAALDFRNETARAEVRRLLDEMDDPGRDALMQAVHRRMRQDLTRLSDFLQGPGGPGPGQSIH